MEPFSTHKGIIATLDRANVDTDQIIPKQFLKSIKRTGFGPAAFFDWRYIDGNKKDPNFELNQERFKGRTMLVAGNNFGCGSSREHAVWALAQDGYRVIVAPSRGEGDSRVPGFADIFRNNCLKNGVLTVELSTPEVEQIFALIEANVGLEATADLAAQTLTLHVPDGYVSFSFEVGASAKAQLLSGQDDIDLTMESLGDIETFETTHNHQLAGSS